MALKGKTLTEEHKRKISEAQKGEKGYWYGKKMPENMIKKKSESAKNAGVGKWMKGRKLSKRTRENISKASTKKYLNDPNHPFKREISGINHHRYGKKHTKETKEKISKANAGRFLGKNSSRYGKHHTAETRKKISEANKGRKQSIETRRKMRLSSIKWVNENKGQFYPRYNHEASNFFEYLNKSLSLNGLHGASGKEYYIEKLGYWLDYYEPNLNLVIEWDENHHYEGEILNEKDKLRQNEIEKHLGCKFLRIRQDNNLNGQLNLIITYTEILKNRKFLS